MPSQRTLISCRYLLKSKGEMMSTRDLRNSSSQQTSEPSQADQDDALRSGPRGALLLVTVAVGALFVGWLLFYFLLFMRRGYVG
jgi:hypothetical protein